MDVSSFHVALHLTTTILLSWLIPSSSSWLSSCSSFSCGQQPFWHWFTCSRLSCLSSHLVHCSWNDLRFRHIVFFDWHRLYSLHSLWSLLLHPKLCYTKSNVDLSSLSSDVFDWSSACSSKHLFISIFALVPAISSLTFKTSASFCAF